MQDHRWVLGLVIAPGSTQDSACSGKWGPFEKMGYARDLGGTVRKATPCYYCRYEVWLTKGKYHWGSLGLCSKESHQVDLQSEGGQVVGC